MKLIEKIKATQAKKKMNLIDIMKVVEPSSGRSVTLELVSEEYKMRWYKKRLCVLAESTGPDIVIEGNKATFTFRNSVLAELFRGLFKNKNTNHQA